MMQIIGGSTYKIFHCTPPYGTQFFHFHIHFLQKVPASEVNAPPKMGPCPPPMGNPGSTPADRDPSTEKNSCSFGNSHPEVKSPQGTPDIL